ncbi:MAG: Fe-S cluster assembly protein SufD [Myxococcota bacterium]
MSESPGLLSQVDGELPGHGVAWLEQLRREARALFSERGLPTTHDEDWRFTDLGELARAELEPAPQAPADVPVPSEPELVPATHRLVFSGGRLNPERSSFGSAPEGARVSSLAEMLEREPERVAPWLGSCVEPKSRSLTALNSALFADGAFVELSPGVALEAPIHLLYTEAETGPRYAVHPRNLIVAGEGSHFTLVEHYTGAGAGGGFTNTVTEIVCGPNARVDHVVLQEQPPESFHLAELGIRQERDSQVRSHSLALGSRLSRLDIRCLLEGEGAQIDLLGTYLARDRQHVDHHTTIDHATPRTTSRELYKGILNDRGRGVFHGRIHVRPGAQKIDADQTNRTLLLSDHARINTKPQLEIYADDVRCSHGASVGRLDAEQLFYLRSRGIAAEDARALLTLAFASEVTSQLPLESLRAHVDEFVRGWLSRGTA